MREQHPARGVRVSARPLLLLAVFLVLAACGMVPQAADPSSEQASAPPATALPTPSPIPTREKTQDRIQAALTQTQALTHYRFQFNVGSTTREADGTLRPSTRIAVTGAFAGDDVAVTRNAAPDQPGVAQEIVIVDGVTYGRGPLPVSGTNPLLWYTLGADPPPALAPPLTLNVILSALTARIDLADFTPVGSVREGDPPCERYLAGLPVALGALDGLGAPTTAEAQAAEATPVVDRMEAQGYRFSDAEASLVVCADGLVYRFTSRFTVESLDAPGQQTTTELQLVMTEPNGTITITVPPDPLTPDAAGVAPARAFALQGGTLYAAPDLTGAVVAELPPLALLVVLAQGADGQWYHVRTVGGEDGWIQALQIDFGPDATPVVPIVP